MNTNEFANLAVGPNIGGRSMHPKDGRVVRESEKNATNKGKNAAPSPYTVTRSELQEMIDDGTAEVGLVMVMTEDDGTGEQSILVTPDGFTDLNPRDVPETQNEFEAILDADALLDAMLENLEGEVERLEKKKKKTEEDENALAQYQQDIANTIEKRSVENRALVGLNFRTLTGKIYYWDEELQYWREIKLTRLGKDTVIRRKASSDRPVKPKRERAVKQAAKK